MTSVGRFSSLVGVRRHYRGLDPADFVTSTVSCHECDARITVTVPRSLPKGSYIVARHVGTARHAPELWQGQRRIT